MNKAELVEAIQDKFESKAKAERAVNAVIEALKTGLKRKPKGTKVQIVGFGTFTVKEKKAREGRNPRTGAKIDIPKSKTVGFKAGKELKEML